MNFALPVGSLEKSISLLIVFPDMVRGKKKITQSKIGKKKVKKKSTLFEISVFILATANTMKQINYTRNTKAM